MCACILRDPVVGLRDSKKLSASRRSSLAPRIDAASIFWCVTLSMASTIDANGIAQCKRHCMTVAARRCLKYGDYPVIVDGVDPIPGVKCKCVIGADDLIPSVSAASVLAKVIHDGIMRYYSEKWPQYGFERNQGYLTREHRAALDRYGITPIHRRSYAPIKGMV